MGLSLAEREKPEDQCSNAELRSRGKLFTFGYRLRTRFCRFDTDGVMCVFTAFRFAGFINGNTHFCKAGQLG